ncbi:MAG: division/cell wall cluster transcriptional repressor MraZ [Candidatus Marinimicrobia bacterium]|nr:division/cell wall cluster transcriptional repressor MraZ [Candidatus Neomarinimicrobiota bacterium]
MALNENTFIGEYAYTIDAKGRVNIPAKFRQVLSEDNEQTFVITKGQDPCVWVYPQIVWQDIMTELRSLSSLSAMNRTVIRSTTRYATFSTYDKQGRIQIPQALIDYAQFDKDVLIIGMVNKIEIWNPANMDQIDQANQELDPAAYEELANKIIL